MESKKDIRKRVLEKRNSITETEWKERSHRIYEKVVSHPFFLSAKEIYCYVDYRNEVGTREIIKKAWSLQKKVAVPKVEGSEMSFYYIKEFSDLEEGYRGIPEPKPVFPAQNILSANFETQTIKSQPTYMADHILVIMPGTVFDKERNRIGYGKGYYDKFLSAHKVQHTMAICFECQIVDVIPADVYDIHPEVLITEENIYDDKLTK